MSNKSYKIITILIPIGLLVIFGPIIWTMITSATKYTSEKCEDLGGEYVNQFMQKNRCYIIEDDKLIDLFDE